MAWFSVVESILYCMCVVVFVVEDIVLSIWRSGSTERELSISRAARDFNGSLKDT